MKLTFFKRVGEKIHHPFRKENTETVIVSEAVPQPEVDNAAGITINEPSVAMSADKCAEQARYFLSKDNKLVSKLLSSHHPETRIIHVDSFVNTFLFLLRMYDQHLLTYRQIGEHLHCTAVFPDESGNLYSTNEMTCRSKENTAVVLKIDHMGLKPRISEIRLELNVKK